ncbi:MAG: sulfatase-like hydrolase/transferase [Planctomycetota bacterium]
MSNPAQPSDGRRQPNVVVFVADDQTYRSINALNNTEVQTPNLDRLVRRGTSFTHAHHQGSWTGAVCIASRAMLHTGRMLYHCGGNDCGDHPLLGETFGARGYDTACFGKWHNYGPSNPQGRSFAHIGVQLEPPTSSPFDFHTLEVGGDLTNTEYHYPSPTNRWRPDDRTRPGHWKDTDANTDPTGRIHTSTLFVDATLEHLRNHVESGSEIPFFTYTAFYAPHDPRQAPTEFLERYPIDDVDMPANFLPKHPFDQGDYRLRDEQLCPWPRTGAAVRTHRRDYHAILTHMDAELGRVLDYLHETGLADETIIVWTADHGLAVGQHGLMGKQNMYDHSVRVPLIFAGPGVPADQRRNELVYQHSVFATLADLAGVDAPASVQFPSLAPLIRGEDTTAPHENIFCSYRHYQRMCRSRTHKLILYPHNGRWQLFDVENDPLECVDLAKHDDAKHRYRGIIEPLWDALTRWQRRVGDQLQLNVSDFDLGFPTE